MPIDLDESGDSTMDLTGDAEDLAVAAPATPVPAPEGVRRVHQSPVRRQLVQDLKQMFPQTSDAVLIEVIAGEIQEQEMAAREVIMERCIDQILARGFVDEVAPPPPPVPPPPVQVPQPPVPVPVAVPAVLPPRPPTPVVPPVVVQARHDAFARLLEPSDDEEFDDSLDPSDDDGLPPLPHNDAPPPQALPAPDAGVQPVPVQEQHADDQPGPSNTPSPIDGLACMFPHIDESYFRRRLTEGITAEQLAAWIVENMGDASITRKANTSNVMDHDKFDRPGPSNANAGSQYGYDASSAPKTPVDKSDVGLPGNPPPWTRFFKTWESLDAASFGKNVPMNVDASEKLEKINLHKWLVHYLSHRFRTLYWNTVDLIVRDAGQKHFHLLAVRILEKAEADYIANHPEAKSLPLAKYGNTSLKADGEIHGIPYCHTLRLLKTYQRSADHPQLSSCPYELLQKQLEYDELKTGRAEIERRQQEQMDELQQSGEALECDICCDTRLFRQFVACSDGHMACGQCLSQTVEQALAGSSSTQLTCIAETKCPALYDPVLLKMHLSDATLKRLEERQYYSGIAGISDDSLERCPKCNAAFFIEVPVEMDKVLDCQNPSCRVKTCRVCKNDWDDDHFGKPCKELETDEETQKRKQYEEQMTETMLRRCPKCQQAILKEEGCNKMTCNACRRYFCYVCKQGITDKDPYSHFCRHMHDPQSKKCQQNCNRCLLFADTKKQDEVAVKNLQKEATDELSTEDMKRKVGASFDGPTAPKQPRTQHHQFHGQVHRLPRPQFYGNMHIPGEAFIPRNHQFHGHRPRPPPPNPYYYQGPAN